MMHQTAPFECVPGDEPRGSRSPGRDAPLPSTKLRPADTVLRWQRRRFREHWTRLSGWPTARSVQACRLHLSDSPQRPWTLEEDLRTHNLPDHKIAAMGPATRYDAFAPSVGALDWRRVGSTCSGATRSRWNERGEIMHRPVRFADDIEPLVQFVQETEPSRILEATLGKLRDGLSVKKLLTASALAVTRSSDLPPGHHGGPLHPLVGIHALHNTVERVSGDQRLLPILQHVALSNKHINHLGMGPYILADAKRSEEHTSELQSQSNLVCRLLLENKKTHQPCRTSS